MVTRCPDCGRVPVAEGPYQWCSCGWDSIEQARREREERYQIVLDDGQFFYVTAGDRREALESAIELVGRCEVHKREEV